MEIKIGIQNVGRELTINADASKDEILKVLQESGPTVEFTDKDGRITLVQKDVLAYIQIGEELPRKVGFSA